METESIIERIKSLCFSQNLNGMTRGYVHYFIIGELANMLINNCYHVVSEYQLSPRLSTNRRTGESILYGGLIDLMAFRNSQTIAIEFDNGLHLKYKSIEKLLYSDAKTLIGIVKGNRAFPRLLEENKQRIIWEMKGLHIIDKKVLLIMIVEKTAVDISLEK